MREKTSEELFLGALSRACVDQQQFVSKVLQVPDRLKPTRLLPAWPKDWNVSFLLHAPYQTTVEGEVKDDRLVTCKVTPSERMKDVIIPDEWQ
jgi:hypothetical protein